MTKEERLKMAYKALSYEGENITRCAKYALSDKDYEGFINSKKRAHNGYMGAYNDFIKITKLEEKQ